MSTLLSAHAAAARLGVSDRTVRRWIAAGRLRADKAEGEFRIALEDLDILTGHDAAAAAAPGHEPDNAAAPNTGRSRLGAAPAAALSDGLSSLVALIERQQAQLLEQTAAAAMWQERARVLSDQLALAAPQSPVEGSGGPIAPEPTVESPLPRWRAGAPWLLAVLAIVAAVLLVAGPR